MTVLDNCAEVAIKLDMKDMLPLLVEDDFCSNTFSFRRPSPDIVPTDGLLVEVASVVAALAAATAVVEAVLEARLVLFPKSVQSLVLLVYQTSVQLVMGLQASAQLCTV